MKKLLFAILLIGTLHIAYSQNTQHQTNSVPDTSASSEQSGYLVLGLANPIRDIKILEKAREDVFSILENDPDLLLENNRIIARVLEEAAPFKEVVF